MQILLLGSLEVLANDGSRIAVTGNRLRALLVSLALEAGRTVPKATLIERVWGADAPDDSSNALHRLVSRLRKTLQDAEVEAGDGGYRLHVAPDDVDALRFERLVASGGDGQQRAGRLREALDLWRGAAVQDLGLPDSAAFDAIAARFERLRLAAVEERFEIETALGHGAELVPELTDLVAAHPSRQRLVAALMRALADAGDDAEALRVYHRTKDLLADELGIDPSPELSALHVGLLRGEAAPRERGRTTNLRAELTSFIGRDADLSAVVELVDGHRLTTLTGPGGSGKTRLAVEAARRLHAALPEGVWLVELAALGPEDDVAGAVLAALGARDALLGEAPEIDAADRVAATLRDREVLLVLDNCEHVIESAAAFAHRLLGECHRLRILATSREPLGITGERLWPVAPLAVPGPDAAVAEIEAAPAVMLLRDRAGAVRRGVAADAGSIQAMARVCQALDGMPLAIELAAARLRSMSLAQLADRLDDRFRLLTGGSRTALPRHQTLRAVIDWSWELLSGPERAVLRRLSVFSGGASLEAAERVCSGGEVAPDEVLELLTSLTEKSLLIAEQNGALRFRMLGTIEEYAAGRLAEAGEAETARRAHLAHFTELAETAAPHLRRAEQLEWLAVLDPDHDNFAAAIRRALAAGDAEAGLRLAASAGWYWWLAGRKSEGMGLLVAAAAAPGEATAAARAGVRGVIAMFTNSALGDECIAAEWIQRQFGTDRTDWRHLLPSAVGPLSGPGDSEEDWARLLDAPDPWLRAMGRLQIGKRRIQFGHEPVDFHGHVTAAHAEFEALGDRYGIAYSLTTIAAVTAMSGDFARACDHYERVIAVVAEIGSYDDIVRLRAKQAELHWLLGDTAACDAALAEAERHAEHVTWPGTLSTLALAKADLARWSGDAAAARRRLDVMRDALDGEADEGHLGAIFHQQLGYLAEDLAEARDHLTVACRAAADTGHAPIVAETLLAVADLALRQGDPAQALRVLASAAALHGGTNLARYDHARIERAARDLLGDTLADEAAASPGDWRALAASALGQPL